MYNKLKQFIKNYSIHNKLKRTLGSILGLAIFLMIVVISVVLFISSRTNSLYGGPYKVSQTISDIRVNLQTMNMNMYRSIIETNLDDRNIYLQLANEESAKLTSNLGILKEIFKEDPSLLNEFLSSIQSTEDKRTKLCDLLKSDVNPLVIEASQEAYSMQIANAQNYIVKIFESSQNNAKSFVNTSNIYKNILLGVIILIIAIIIGISFLLSKVLEDSLVEGINHIKYIAKNLSSGHLKIDSTYDSKDEMGEMSYDLTISIEMLVSYISDITTALEKLGSGNLDIHLDTSIEYIGDFTPIQKSIKNIINSLNTIFFNMHKSISSISNGSEQLSLTTQMLSEGSADQAGVDQISQVVQMNSATAQELAASTEELVYQTQLIETEISKYTLKDNKTL